MHPNLLMLLSTAHRLGDLRGQVVFVGGAMVPLFLTDPLVPSPRSTKHVDVIIEVTTPAEYYRFAERLRRQGFHEDVEAKVLCRWRSGDLILDVMPIEPQILGFSNRWYGEAIRNASEQEIVPGEAIRLVTAPYFIATKIEAFLGRGKGDFLDSADVEDIITVMDGRIELRAEIAAAPAELRSYLAGILASWLNNDHFVDALSGHLLPDAASQARVPVLIRRAEEITRLCNDSASSPPHARA